MRLCIFFGKPLLNIHPINAKILFFSQHRKYFFAEQYFHVQNIWLFSVVFCLSCSSDNAYYFCTIKTFSKGTLSFLILIYIVWTNFFESTSGSCNLVLFFSELSNVNSGHQYICHKENRCPKIIIITGTFLLMLQALLSFLKNASYIVMVTNLDNSLTAFCINYDFPTVGQCR